MGSYDTDEQFIVYGGIKFLNYFLPDDCLHSLKIVVLIEINKVYDNCVFEVYILPHINILLNTTGFPLLSLT